MRKILYSKFVVRVFACFILCLIFILKVQGQILNGSLSLTTQAQVDAFNYTTVTGTLQIYDPTLTGAIRNLDGLSELTSVGGHLIIHDNSGFDNQLGYVGITNLNGLSNLSSVGGHLLIEFNTILSNCDGLSHLNTVGGNVFIRNNDLMDLNGLSSLKSVGGLFTVAANRITNITGLSSLTTIGGDFSIAEKYLYSSAGLSHLSSIGGTAEISGFADLSGFSGLTTIGKNLVIRSIDATNVNGLSHLTSVGGSLSIFLNSVLTNIDGLSGLTTLKKISIGGGNPNLQNIYGLSNLTSVTGDPNDPVCITIGNNDALTNVDGLVNLTSVAKNIEITANPKLSQFCGLYGLLSTNGLAGTLSIQNNLTNPTTQQIINGGACLFDEYFGDLFLTTQDEVDAFQYRRVTGFLSINEASPGAITNLNPLMVLRKVGSHIFLTNNSAIANVNGLANLDSVGGEFDIFSNTALTNIDLPNLATVKKTLNILGNAALTTLGIDNLVNSGGIEISSNAILTKIDGLNNLTIAGGLVLNSNPQLISIHGLSHLDQLTGRLSMRDNPMLVDLGGLSNLDSIDAPASSFPNLFFALNSSMKDLIWLSKLRFVSGNVLIANNTSLENFCGLYTLATVNGVTGSFSTFGNVSNPTLQDIANGAGCTVNNCPVALSLNVLTSINAVANFQLQGSDQNNDPLIYSISENPLHGTASITTSGTATYTPNANYSGIDQFKYKVNDGSCVQEAVVTITIQSCPTANALTVSMPVGTSANIQLQGSGPQNDPLVYTISQQPSHGIVNVNATGLATYIPNTGYYGADQFKYTMSDGKCEAEATVTITIVQCPHGAGYWKNHQEAWPASAIPMMLGTRTYTKSQLISILNMPIGNGNNADASLILADQEIVTKLNIANGSPIADHLNDSLASADRLIGNNNIPMKVKPNSALGKRMVAVAEFLSSYNNGSLTEGCAEAAVTSSIQTNTMSESIRIPSINELEVNAYPNPTNTYFQLQLASNKIENTFIQVVDMYGRIIEIKNVAANSIIKLGDRYRPGTYFVRVIQGKQHKEIKLIKLLD
jgi:hypothetical protein